MVAEWNNSVAHARNLIAQQALNEGVEHVFWLDDDLLFAPDVLLRLLARDVDIVMGLTMMRARQRDSGSQFQPLWSTSPLDWTTGVPVWTPIDEIQTNARGLMPLESGTGGGVLTRTSVFQTVKPLWWEMGQIWPDLYFEDITFYQKCRAAGIEIVGDPDVRFGHMHAVTFWPHQQQDGSWSTVIADGFEGFLSQPWTAPTRTHPGDVPTLLAQE